MDQKNRKAQVEGWLRLIERVRLLYNSSDELGQLVGYSVNSRNSLARKGGNSLFMKEAIFRQLCQICEEQTDMDLQEIVEAYEDVDNFIDRYSTLLRDNDLLPAIVNLFFGNGDVPDDLAFVSKRLDVRHIPILLLMLTGSLPRLSAKNGDVQGIEEDFQRTFSLLRETCKTVFLQELPAISMMESEVKAHPDKRNRLHLIHAATFILNAYGAVSTQERLSLANRDLLSNRVCPSHLEGIWTEDDSFTMFWLFEEINNGFYLYHYTLKNDQKRLTYTKYFVSFFQLDDDDDEVEAVIMHPQIIRYIVNNQPLPNMLISYNRCQIEEGEIVLVPKGDDEKWFQLRRLKKSSHAKFFQTLLDDERKEKVNEWADTDYNFYNCLAAITPDTIYMFRAEGGYYKIPKSINDVLYDVQSDDNVGVVSFDGSIYVAFDDKSLYYDVTTEEKMREAGIEVVDTITP